MQRVFEQRSLKQVMFSMKTLNEIAPQLVA